MVGRARVLASGLLSTALSIVVMVAPSLAQEGETPSEDLKGRASLAALTANMPPSPYDASRAQVGLASGPSRACAELCRTPAVSHELGVLMGFGLGSLTGNQIGLKTRRAPFSAVSEFGPLTFARHWKTGTVSVASLALAKFAIPALLKHPPSDQTNDPICVDCQPGSVGGPDGWARGAIRWKGCHRGLADRLSDSSLLFSLFAPTTYIVTASQPRRATDLALVAESLSVTLLVTETAKYVTKRRRPYHLYCDFPCGATSKGDDPRLSFFSGHTATAFAMAASVSTIADRRGYPHASGIRWASYASAGLTGYLRIAADRHYLSDVVVGGAVGFFVGRTLPRLHKLQPVESLPSSRTYPAVAVSAPVMPLGWTVADRRGGVVNVGLGLGGEQGIGLQVSRYW